jgi:hypothetical protein
MEGTEIVRKKGKDRMERMEIQVPSEENIRRLDKKISLFFLWRCGPTWVMASSFLRFLDYTQRRTTVGRTPLHE